MKTLNKDQQNFVMQNLPIVTNVIKRIKNVNQKDFEDLASVGKIGLCKAVAKFDKNKGYKFSSFAYKVIENEIYMHFRKNNRHLNIDSLDDLIYTDKDPVAFIEYLVDNHSCNFIKDTENNDLLSKCLNVITCSLDYESRKIILLVMGNYSQETISKEFDLERSSISKRLKLIRANINTLLKKNCYLQNFEFTVLEYNYKFSFFSLNEEISQKISENYFNSNSNFNFSTHIQKENCNLHLYLPRIPESFIILSNILLDVDFKKASF